MLMEPPHATSEPDYMENTPISELNVGDQAQLSRQVTAQDIKAFAALSGDVNPIHLDDAFAKQSSFGSRIAHGHFCTMLITTVIGTQLPGPGTIYRGQEYKFHNPAFIGDTLTVKVTIDTIKARARLIMIANEITNQNGDVLITGTSTVVGPTEKLRVPRPRLNLDDNLIA